VIRNAVVHMNNEQPLSADLQALPTATDACLICTNLRYIDGKKPSFIDRVDSWFMIPLSLIRFIEVPQASIEESGENSGVLALPAGPLLRPPVDEIDEDAESDELLRRIREA
jgi:hypothetical protein